MRYHNKIFWVFLCILFYGNYYVYLCVYIVINDYLCVYITMHDNLCLKRAKWLIIIFVCMILFRVKK